VVRDLLAFLGSAGVVTNAVPRNERAKRSLYDPVSWSYADDWDARGNLEAALYQALAAARPSLDARARLWLWRQLSDRELCAYLTSLLRRHRISDRWVDGIIAQQKEHWVHLSLGRKRYVAWSAVRGAASQYLTTGGDEEAAIRVMSLEMRKRARWLTSKESTGELQRTDFCFVPDTSWRRPLMLEIALESILPIGSDYWLAAPPKLCD